MEDHQQRHQSEGGFDKEGVSAVDEIAVDPDRRATLFSVA
jgi:hypothetical protein